MKNLKLTKLTALAVYVFFVACQEEKIVKNESFLQPPPIESLRPESMLMSAGRQTNTVSEIPGMGKRRIKMYMAEYVTTGKDQKSGNTVFFNDRGNKQLPADFTTGLNLDGSDHISFYVDNTRPSKYLSSNSTSNAIGRVMDTWDKVKCSTINMKRAKTVNYSTGLVSLIFGYGGSDNYVADINHAGWLPRSFFDLIAPNGGSYILVVTFTITFVDKNGNPLDSDKNNKTDVAWREIYYNDAF